MRTPPEQTEAQVEVIEKLRNAKDRSTRAVASMMDTRIEWYMHQAMNAARADGYNNAEVLSALISINTSSIFGLIKMEPDRDGRSILTALALIELQINAEKLVEMLK